MAFDWPLYLLQTADRLLIAATLDDLIELVAVANETGREIKLVHAYYSPSFMPTYHELKRIAELLARN